MTERLRFGTAGLRAPLGEGPACMNVQTVALAARALAEWLPAASLVVVGHDARYGSSDFALVTARDLIAAGHRVELFDRPIPTPLVAWRVASSPAAAGVVVTASHNPATDNGYKVYGATGAQILPADATTIERLMDAQPWPAAGPVTLEPTAQSIGDDVIDEYMFAVGRGAAAASLNIVYSAMHGVGGELAVRMLSDAGHTVYPVAEQFDPDPDFPTAPFPNPEEPGALDLAMAFAERHGSEHIDLILAHDPDADRLAVAVHRDGRWVRLSGDEIGVLLGAHLLRVTPAPRSVATTIVSSSLLSKIAAAEGAGCVTTLTGFKWLVAADTDPDNPQCFAYEEALGYAVSPFVKDKDGLSAALAFAELAAEAKAEGRSVDHELAGLFDEHGVHLTGQVSLRFDGDDPMQQMTEVMDTLRANPVHDIGGHRVIGVRDLLHDDELPPSDVLIHQLESGRVIVRPSGTEPKLKVYVEAVAQRRPDAERMRSELEAAAGQLVGH
jgi:phosphomannomutase